MPNETPENAAPAVKPALITVLVDGERLEFEKGANLLNALDAAGKKVPRFCYHKNLSVAGNCRMCMVETARQATDPVSRAPLFEPDGSPKLAWTPKPAAACATTVDGSFAAVRTNSPALAAARAGVLEFLLLNHPLDCPICDKAGECSLQEQAFAHGRGVSRNIDAKNDKPKRVQLGPRIIYDAERCILCSRCIRFCREVAKDPVLGFVRRGSDNYVASAPGRSLNGAYSLNTVDLCPVGALTDTAFRFKNRVWFLRATPSISHVSSVGVNTTVWSREGKILRITPRRNDAVNDAWMPDAGRDLHQRINTRDRLTDYIVNGTISTAGNALSAAARLLSAASAAGKLGAVITGRMSFEEQFLLRELFAAAPAADTFLPLRLGANDGLLISEDRSPNTRGALVAGLFNREPDTSLAPLADAIAAGKIDTLAVFREDVTALGISGALLKKQNVKIVYLTTHADALTVFADVVLPALTVFEKNGCFINQQFRLQRFRQAIAEPDGVIGELELFPQLLALLKKENAAGSAGNAAGDVANAAGIAEVWQRIADAVPALAGISFENIPDTGLLLDSAPWQHLRFPETGSLHYKPIRNS